jgi:hypothetical protein
MHNNPTSSNVKHDANAVMLGTVMPAPAGGLNPDNKG